MNPSPSSPVWQTIVATVENKPGVLARVAGLFSRRGFNIHSLAVAPTEDERFSRITFTVDVEGTPRDQVVKQLVELLIVTASRSAERVNLVRWQRHSLLEQLVEVLPTLVEACHAHFVAQVRKSSGIRKRCRVQTKLSGFVLTSPDGRKK